MFFGDELLQHINVKFRLSETIDRRAARQSAAGLCVEIEADLAIKLLSLCPDSKGESTPLALCGAPKAT